MEDSGLVGFGRFQILSRSEPCNLNSGTGKSSIGSSLLAGDAFCPGFIPAFVQQFHTRCYIVASATEKISLIGSG
jgi:hypothetical protein